MGRASGKDFKITTLLNSKKKLHKRPEVEVTPRQLLRKTKKKNFSSQSSSLSLTELLSLEPKSQLISEDLRGLNKAKSLSFNLTFLLHSMMNSLTSMLRSVSSPNSHRAAPSIEKIKLSSIVRSLLSFIAGSAPRTNKEWIP